MVRLMATVNSTAAGMSRSKLFMVILLSCCVVSSALQLVDMGIGGKKEGRGGVKTERRGEAREAMRFRLCFEMGDHSVQHDAFPHHFGSVNRR